MQEEKMTELLMDLSNKISTIQKDVEYLKSEMHTNYIRSDEADSAVRDLLEERTKWAANRQDSIKAELAGQISLIKKENELQSKQIEALDDRIQALADEKKNRVYARWQQIIDKIFLLVVAAAFAAVLKWLNLPLIPS